MTQWGFTFNADECTGCKACVVACKDVHDLPVGYKLRRVVTAEAGEWVVDKASGLPVPSKVFSFSVSYSCMHCKKPACVAACRKGAVQKDAATGIVFIDQELCLGCGRCASACPWEAPVVIPRIDGSCVARKCDLCRDLLRQGEEPACVAACLMRCLKAGVLPDDAAPPRNAVLAEADDLGPNMICLPHRFDTGLVANDIVIHSMPEEYVNG